LATCAEKAIRKKKEEQKAAAQEDGMEEDARDPEMSSRGGGKDAGRRGGHTFSKVLSLVAVYGQRHGTLTFEKCWQEGCGAGGLQLP